MDQVNEALARRRASRAARQQDLWAFFASFTFTLPDMCRNVLVNDVRNVVILLLQGLNSAALQDADPESDSDDYDDYDDDDNNNDEGHGPEGRPDDDDPPAEPAGCDDLSALVSQFRAAAESSEAEPVVNLLDDDVTGAGAVPEAPTDLDCYVMPDVEPAPVPEVSRDDQSNPVPEVFVDDQSNPVPEVPLDDQSTPVPEVSVDDQSTPVPEVSVDDQSTPVPEVSLLDGASSQDSGRALEMGATAKAFATNKPETQLRRV